MTEVYALWKGPTYQPLSPNDMMADALNQPMGFLDTLSDQYLGSLVNTAGVGTVIREATLPEGMPEQGFWSQKPLFGFGETEYQEKSRHLRQMTEDEYKASPYYRKDVPYDPRFTEDRAAAVAMHHDAQKVREYFASKRPFWSFVSNMVGQASDPLNYIPTAGPLVKGAAAARLGRFWGEVAASSLDAVSNTALGQVAAYPTRREFGDDITWQSTVSEIAMAGLIGAAFGGIHGAVNLYRQGRATERLREQQRLVTEQLSTLENTQNARIALNDAIDRVVDGEDVELSPNSIDNIKAVANYPALQELSEGADTISGGQIDRLAGSQELPQKVRKPQSLLNFLASEGGIRDDGGELATLGLSKKFLPGRGALVRKNGLSLDYAREAAAQAGYLDGIYGNPETAVEKSTIADFLNLLDQEHRGDPVYASRDAAQLQSARDYEEAIRSRGDFKKLLSEFSDEINKQKIGVSLPDELISRAVEIHHEEGVSALSALDRAIVEDEAKFYASMEEKGLASNEDPRYADIPFFDEPAANAAAKGRALGGKEQTGSSGRIGTNVANGRSAASARLDTSTARIDQPPAGIKEAAARVGKPDDLKALAEQFGVKIEKAPAKPQAKAKATPEKAAATEEKFTLPPAMEIVEKGDGLHQRLQYRDITNSDKPDPVDGSLGTQGITFYEQGNDLYIAGSYLPSSARGQGKGFALYEALAKYAQSLGKTIYSDTDVSASALKVYDKLKDAGFDVQKSVSFREGADSGYPGKFIGGMDENGVKTDGFTLRILPEKASVESGPYADSDEGGWISGGDGHPLTLYHGTQAGFDDFDGKSLVWVTPDRDQAIEYSELFGSNGRPRGKPRVVETNVRMRRPFDIDADAPGETIDAGRLLSSAIGQAEIQGRPISQDLRLQAAKVIERAGLGTKEKLRFWQPDNVESFKEFLKMLGFDGVIHREESGIEEGKTVLTYGALNPSDVRDLSKPSTERPVEPSRQTENHIPEPSEAANPALAETATFIEQSDIDQLRQEGRLTEEDEADLIDADTTFENSVAFGEALRAAVACLI